MESFELCTYGIDPECRGQLAENNSRTQRCYCVQSGELRKGQLFH